MVLSLSVGCRKKETALPVSGLAEVSVFNDAGGKKDTKILPPDTSSAKPSETAVPSSPSPVPFFQILSKREPAKSFLNATLNQIPMSERDPSGSSGERRFSDKSDFDLFLNVCAFPHSLRDALEQELKTDCADMTIEHLSQVSRLSLRDIDEEQTRLLSKRYTYFFPVLYELDISDNPDMQNLPEFALNIYDLKKLDISRTGISEFRESICNLENLTTLIGSHNNYKGREVPFKTFCLFNLKVLDMSYSNIYYIDEYIHKLEKLEELYMAGNLLMSVPFMLHRMPHLLLVDFTENNFESRLWLSQLFSWLRYEPLNALYDCTKTNNEKDRKKCQKNMSFNFECEWIQKVNFKRGGQPFRQYKEIQDMTCAERKTFKRVASQPSINRCYNFWLNNVYIPLSDSQKEEFMERTINGKTLREWKLIYSIREEYSWVRKFGVPFGGGSLCEHRILYSDTTHIPSSHEVFPEKHHAPEWTQIPQEECAKQNTDEEEAQCLKNLNEEDDI